MKQKNKNIKLYNVLFPLWALSLFPQTWLFILPGNFLIDSLVLWISMSLLKITDKNQWYRRHIFKIFAFGMIADAIGVAGMLLFMTSFDVATMGDELYLTLPALLLSAILIFVFNYFITFKNAEKRLRFPLSMIFAIATAPYTFLIPSSWIY